MLTLVGNEYTAVDIVGDYPELVVEDVYQAAMYDACFLFERRSWRVVPSLVKIG